MLLQCQSFFTIYVLIRFGKTPAITIKAKQQMTILLVFVLLPENFWLMVMTVINIKNLNKL